MNVSQGFVANVGRFLGFAHALHALLKLQGVSERDLSDAAGLASQGHGVLASVMRTGGINDAELYRCAALLVKGQCLSSAACDALMVSAEPGALAAGLSLKWCRAQRLIVWIQAGIVHVLMADWPTTAQHDLVCQFGDFELAQLYFAPAQWFDHRQSASIGVEARSGTSVEQLRLLSEEGPVIELVNQILSQGAMLRASDIHLEAREHNFLVRFRVDGNMGPPSLYARSLFDASVVRIKILSGLDIAERRLPQDGRIQVRLNGDDFDIRVSVLPASFGEGIALRLLRSKRQLFSMIDLGMQAQDEAFFSSLLHLPNGIVLVTGPTGSGKSTTLYTGLSLVNDGKRKIITVEDPVEYRIEGITQIQANASIGLDFASSLRGILRHDPDVILIGEIRDRETAEIAVQAALTGHLVLSTLHTNSAIGSITRLIDMGVEPFLLSATVRALLAQRLVRMLCQSCRVESNVPPALKSAWAQAGLAADDLNPLVYLPAPGGCQHCGHTGYFGRLALYEFAAMNEPVRAALREHKFAEGQLKELSRETPIARVLGDGDQSNATTGSLRLQSMLQDGLIKCNAGLTSLDEVLSVIEQV